MIEILEADLSGQLDVEFAAETLQAGQDSPVVEFAIRNTGPEDELDLLLVIQVASLTTPNLYVSIGLPPQDELWARVRLTGHDNTDAPGQQDYRVDWTPLGAYAVLHIPALLAGGVRYGELKVRPPSTAGNALTWRWHLSVIGAEHSRAVPPVVAARGILPQIGDRTFSGLLRGFETTVSGPADDQVHVAAGVGIVRGEIRTSLAVDLTLDDLDGNAEALDVGEGYKVTLSLGDAGVTETRGGRAISPDPPPAPAGEALIEQFEVRYDAGGVVIEATDLAGMLTYTRYRVEPGVGLQAIAHSGQAVGGGTWRYHSARQPVPLEASSTNFIWQRSGGELEVTQTAAAPETTALGPWAEVDTDVAAVTAVRDRRTWAERPVVLHLQGDLPGAPGLVASLLVTDERLWIEAVLFRISDNGGGASGETVFDLEVNGSSAWPSSGFGGSFDFDAAELRADAGVHELAELRYGDELAFLTTAHPSGGTPAWAEAYVICWRA